ncbi:MAG: restriction endonuclease subunit M [Bacteroidia bacterium]|nr:restriction endonuclease subunit M [Bacteroidia bacterium]
MQLEADILENYILEKYPTVLEILLLDRTTEKNIFWATENYETLGPGYKFNDQILPELITGLNGNVIMPRVKKEKSMQQSRARDMAEVFTPSWICNAQNNLIDQAWFGKENVFNIEISNNKGIRDWVVNNEKIKFPVGKSWLDYVLEPRLEVSCGEAPYLTSRYDTTTGAPIKVENRIGLLDRKLRVISENIEKPVNWIENAQLAYKNIYGFEWQGDNLILAREALLYTYIDYYFAKFGTEPSLQSIQNIAYIISWNIWQMDGAKGVIPKSCGATVKIKEDLFGIKESKISFCEGCLNNDIKNHSGTKCKIKDWSKKDPKTGEFGQIEYFIKSFKS